MKKILFALFVSLCFIQATFAQETKEARDQRMQWWREARFGLFIHWGPYCVLGGVYNGHEQRRGGAEWIMNRCKIPVAEYQKYAATFNPVKYDPESWVLLAKQAGMKYIIITSKHHDGFALFKSNASKWNIADATPYGKDVLKPLAAACKKYGIKLGFYYSQAQDWNNPGGTVARRPMSDGWLNPDSARIDAYTQEHNGHWDPVQESRSFDKYIDEVAVPQVKEILSNYGDIAVLWWDTPTNMTKEAALKLQDLLKLQPNIITNDRLKRPDFPGDTKTPEQRIPKQSELDSTDWETCMTMNGTWGYRTSDNNWKSTNTLIHNLCDIASKGGNYLLNVGPKPDGTFPDQSINALKEMGSWMKINGEAIYATKTGNIDGIPWGRCTRKEMNGNTILYFSVFDWPTHGKLWIPGLTNEIVSATLLSDHSIWKTEKSTSSKEGYYIHVPSKAPDPNASVIRVECKGKVVQAKEG